MNSVRIFRLAQGFVGVLPEGLGRAFFTFVGAIAGSLPTGRVHQLRKNQARLRPGMNEREARTLARSAMISYMRYYYEVFRLPTLSPKQILARVRITGEESIREDIAAGRAFTGALTHSGNWDLAGAWANIALAKVHTLAEKLEPEELYHFFVDTREGVGMRIYPAARGSGSLARLAQDMREATATRSAIFTPILADRDLAVSGVEVDLAGVRAMVAPGPALLAQRTGSTLYPVAISYERLPRSRRKAAGSNWGIRIDILPGIRSQLVPESSGRENAQDGVSANESKAPRSSHLTPSEDVAQMTQAWVSAMEPYLRESLVDWHMLQKVFVSDLDPERLARARARAAEAEAKADRDRGENSCA